jgi:hypothetical protein
VALLSWISGLGILAIGIVFVVVGTLFVAGVVGLLIGLALRTATAPLRTHYLDGLQRAAAAAVGADESVVAAASGFAGDSVAWLWMPGAGLANRRIGVALTSRHVVFVELGYWFDPLRVLLVAERGGVTATLEDSPLGLRATFADESGARFVILTRMWRPQMRSISEALAPGWAAAPAGLQAR